MDQFSVPSRMKNLFHGTAPAQSGDYGLHVLVNKAAEGEGIVDIVAVHGLNGHYKNTWTATRPNGDLVNWLGAVLPKQDVIHARVMSFSYNSSVQFSKSTADVFVFADQLLEHLIGKRQEEGEQRRPIVFICHSLGGIVVKQVSRFFFSAAQDCTNISVPGRHSIGQPKMAGTEMQS